MGQAVGVVNAAGREGLEKSVGAGAVSSSNGCEALFGAPASPFAVVRGEATCGAIVKGESSIQVANDDEVVQWSLGASGGASPLAGNNFGFEEIKHCGV